MYRTLFPAIISLLLTFGSCSSQENAQQQPETPTVDLGPVLLKKEPHRYGGWYCPDNFGFEPVDIQKLAEVPAISNRLPTQLELKNHMSLIDVDTKEYPDARALEMELPRVARIYDEYKGMSELAIIIQAIVVQGDTVVGYRFPNGGNGSARLSDVTLLSDDEVAKMGSQPFFYSRATVKASTADIWNALCQTDYFKELGEKFGEQKFFSSNWNPDRDAKLKLETEHEKATGYAGMLYGNYYLQIDYNRNGFHYSEKLMLAENREDNTTELFFACGPFPQDFETQQPAWNRWFEAVKTASQAR
ncbi:MAG: hypothetical protein H6601_04190 [Flavobacteriales bacterium]|nr:hypothetical protein [Flavobacteriales bacterium]